MIYGGTTPNPLPITTFTLSLINPWLKKVVGVITIGFLSILTDLSSLPQYNLCAHEFEQKVLKPKAKPFLKATPLKNDAKHRDSIFLAKPAYV